MKTYKVDQETENAASQIREYILDKYKKDVVGRKSFCVRTVLLKSGWEVRVELPTFMLEKKKHKITCDVRKIFNRIVI